MKIVIGNLSSHLIRVLFSKLNNCLKTEKSEPPTKVISHSLARNIISVLNHLLPFILYYVVHNDKIQERIEDDMSFELSK